MKIEIHTVDGWEALYADGNLAEQDHSGTLQRFLLDAPKPLTIDSLTCHDDDHLIYDQIAEVGGFPATIKELKKLIKEAK